VLPHNFGLSASLHPPGGQWHWLSRAWPLAQLVTQLPPHNVVPGGQTQLPLEQILPLAVQLMQMPPVVPQVVLLGVVTQVVPVQQPAEQLVALQTQRPPSHTWPGVQAFPQLAQLVLVPRVVQMLLQHFCVAVHGVQLPPHKVSSSTQMLLQHFVPPAQHVEPQGAMLVSHEPFVQQPLPARHEVPFG
jgi:hypothetical protein